MGAKTVRPPVVQWPLTSHAKAITAFGTGSTLTDKLPLEFLNSAKV